MVRVATTDERTCESCGREYQSATAAAYCCTGSD